MLKNIKEFIYRLKVLFTRAGKGANVKLDFNKKNKDGFIYVDGKGSLDLEPMREILEKYNRNDRKYIFENFGKAQND
jgi:hypothetical protein